MPAFVASAWRWIGANKDHLTVVLAIVAGLTTFYQYLESVEDGRRKETLKYVERSQGERLGKARAAVNLALRGKANQQAYDAAVAQAAGDAKDAALLDQFVQERKLDEHLFAITEHFMNLALCAQSGVCDRQLTCEIFAPDIKSIHETFRELFEEVWTKEYGRDFMAGPMAFVKACEAPATALDRWRAVRGFFETRAATRN